MSDHRENPASLVPEVDGTEVRFLSLGEARAIECNGCGDCCDSRRTDGFWTWGSLPADQYAAMTRARPLIIPLERVGVGWRDRAHEGADALSLTPTRFRCVAFEARTDGGGACGVHDQQRPQQCEEFPVWGVAIEADLREHGEVWLQTEAFSRCAWFRVCVVGEEDVRIRSAAGAV